MTSSPDPVQGEAPPAPPRASRRDTEMQARRRDLLAAARKLLRKGGAQAVTMRAVAEVVGVSTTVVYALFPDKAALIAQAVDDDLKRFSRHLQQALAQASDARDALRKVARAYAAFGVAHPQSYRLMFMEARPASPVEDSSIEFGNPSEDAYALARTLADGLLREAGGPPPAQADIETTAQLVWEALHGATSLRITLGDDPWFARLPLEQHIDRMVDVFAAGVLSRSR
ncbi:AcrR family transcriptional regulator [Acidovorax soli]|uniref:AcrR family transcriptional regulator n=1 Tax=Acidovorax soli TaxID=592050 RepID=A0A7X0PLQ1_9BURK|nr:TetR/AcrR family transcriptional regulator [Acidovorax soli]MBB6563721.1 AcrR family transcriptional regulator [Acidovorax soli]